MMPQAFITGLPRSRTYWMAQYFDSHDNVKAHHELSMMVDSPEEFSEAMEGHPTVINVDALLIVTDYKQKWPDAPVVYVERELEESLNSTIDHLINHGKPYNKEALRHTLHPMRDYYAENADLTIPFPELDDRLPEIHELLGIPYSKDTHQVWMGRKLSTPEIIVKRHTIKMWDTAQGVTR